MSALKDLSYKEDEDGELPMLVTGSEKDIEDILQHTKTDGGINIVSENKISRANKQVEEAELAVKSGNGGIKRIPVSVITGYLGSGKSTLLEMIAMKGSDKKIAVILNEFGDSSEIEKAMTIRSGDASYEEWLDLGNGCLCCSLKNVGVKAIEDMIARSPNRIDYILLETSGIADPAPIAKMFWQDEGLNSSVYIDGIISVLDSENIIKCLDDVSPDSHWHGERVVTENNLTIAHFQIAMADRILMNKFDKIENDPVKVKTIEDRIRQINSAAPIYHTKFGESPLSTLLDLHAYDNTNISSVLGEGTKCARPTLHDPRMNTITLTFRQLKDEDEFNRFLKDFLQVLLWRYFGVTQELGEGITHFNSNPDWEIQRTKGLILIGESQAQLREAKVIQGVRDTYDVLPGKVLQGSNESKLVFIGKYLVQNDIEALLNKVLG